jgi:hypothetical protein
MCLTVMMRMMQKAAQSVKAIQQIEKAPRFTSRRGAFLILGQWLLKYGFDQIRAFGRKPGFNRQLQRLAITDLRCLDAHRLRHFDEL